MFFIRVVAAVILVHSFILMTGCNNKSGNPVEVTPHADTSKFIGTWIAVFDTSDNPPGSKEEKLKHWCKGGCVTTDTFEFLNDSIYSGYESGFEVFYQYSEDSIYFYLPIVGTDQKVLDDVHAYYLSNDTLIFDPDFSIYRPVNIRISKTPFNKWNK